MSPMVLFVLVVLRAKYSAIVAFLVAAAPARAKPNIVHERKGSSLFAGPWRAKFDLRREH